MNAIGGSLYSKIIFANDKLTKFSANGRSSWWWFCCSGVWERPRSLCSSPLSASSVEETKKTSDLVKRICVILKWRNLMKINGWHMNVQAEYAKTRIRLARMHKSTPFVRKISCIKFEWSSYAKSEHRTDHEHDAAEFLPASFNMCIRM